MCAAVAVIVVEIVIDVGAVVTSFDLVTFFGYLIVSIDDGSIVFKWCICDIGQNFQYDFITQQMKLMKGFLFGFFSP